MILEKDPSAADNAERVHRGPSGGLGRMAFIIGFGSLRVEPHLPDEHGAILSLHANRSVLPGPILVPPLGSGRVSLILMHFVHAAPGVEPSLNRKILRFPINSASSLVRALVAVAFQPWPNMQRDRLRQPIIDPVN
jgi:hypothetical protein